MPQDATLFVALSTGQNIANILPILEMAEPADSVLWVESATARGRRWSDGALNVLRRHGIDRISCVDVEDDPASIQEILNRQEVVKVSSSVKLVANGGTKPQMLAAFRALNGRLDELLYNHDQHCVLERNPYLNGQPAPVVRQPYARHRVDLSDVLALNGREIVTGHERHVWPVESLPQIPRYGSEANYTGDCHEHVHQWVKGRPDKPKKAFGYAQAADLASVQSQKFREMVLAACGSDANTRIKPKDLEELYNCAHRLDREAWKNQERCADPEQVPDLGRELEDAVAVRLIHWLNKNPRFARIVQSVWCNVKVRLHHGKEDMIELDTALLLKNGRLLPLECKAFDAERKDMNSRLGELQRSSSQLARIALCAPSYPIFAKHAWHRALTEKLAKMQQWTQFNFIEFTLPGQPGASGKTFEEALEAWLKHFLPME